MWRWLGPTLTAMHNVLPVLWMTLFSYDGVNGPYRKTTRMFRRVRQVAAPGTGKVYHL